MVGPRARRQAVDVLRTERGFGITRACGLVGISRNISAPYALELVPTPPLLAISARTPARSSLQVCIAQIMVKVILFGSRSRRFAGDFAMRLP